MSAEGKFPLCCQAELLNNSRGVSDIASSILRRLFLIHFISSYELRTFCLQRGSEYLGETLSLYGKVVVDHFHKTLPINLKLEKLLKQLVLIIGQFNQIRRNRLH